ncbi:hypothetical protein HZA57_04405 [Candidatus Poribacteria bacterium]|nr:hypothetical protein [Candidatus Poribacteria bacterium]
MMQQDDRRRHPRFACDFPAELLVLAPDDSYTPPPMTVRVRQVSRAGVRAQCPHLSGEDHARLMEHMRFAQLSVRMDAAVTSVDCRIAWMSTIPDPAQGSIHELGLAFDASGRESEQAIGTMLQLGEVTREC